MNICVVGGSGFIGVNLCRRLLTLGHEISIVDIRTNAELEQYDKDKKINWYTGNYDDSSLLNKALDRCDVLFHLASSTIPSTSNENPVYDIESNLVASVKLIEAAKNSDTKKIVFISSGGTVYGKPTYTPVDESHELNPICSYGINKLAVEKYLGMYKHIGGPSYVIFRLSNPYGPFQNPDSQQGVIPVFMRRVLSGEPLTIWGDGNVIRDFIYIDDVVDVFIRALDRPDENAVYNVGSGVGLSINDVVSGIVKVCGIRPALNYESSRSIDVPANVLDIRAVKKAYDWAPKVAFEEGLVNTKDYIERWISSQGMVARK